MNRTIYILLILVACCIQLSAQCYTDRHTTNLMDGWMSCTKTANPHAIFGESHWIRYDLGQQYDIYDIQIWNLSHPDHFKSGVRDIVISRSNNGNTWTILDTFTVPRAETTGFYEGVRSIDLKGQTMRYLLITALNNHSGGCAGFSEIRFYTEDATSEEMALDFAPCENGGLYTNISGGMGLGGQYSGAGVTDNGDDSFDFDADEVGPGIYTITYTYQDGGTRTESAQIEVLACGDDRCPDCIDCGSFDQADLDSPDIPDGKYHDELLSASGQVQSSRDVDFRGSQEISLEAGFEVVASSDFLAEIRECYDNDIVNGDLEQELSSWNFWHDPDSVTMTQGLETSDVYEGDYSLWVTITDPEDNENWRAQASNDDLVLEEGKTYRVSFVAKSLDAEGFALVMELDGSPWTNYFSTYVPYKDYWESYSYTFTVDQPVPFDVRFSMHLAEYGGTHLIDNVKVVELD